MKKIIYDKSEYTREIRNNEAQRDYLLSSRQGNPGYCHMNVPGFVSSSSGFPGSIVNTESILRRLDQPYSKCPGIKLKNPKTSFYPPLCGNQMPATEYTRDLKTCNNPNFSIPDRFEKLVFKVQDTTKIQKNNYIGQNSRNLKKDEFKK